MQNEKDERRRAYMCRKAREWKLKKSKGEGWVKVNSNFFAVHLVSIQRQELQNKLE